jgi:hypothetical protein
LNTKTQRPTSTSLHEVMYCSTASSAGDPTRHNGTWRLAFATPTHTPLGTPQVSQGHLAWQLGSMCACGAQGCFACAQPLCHAKNAGNTQAPIHPRAPHSHNPLPTPADLCCRVHPQHARCCTNSTICTTPLPDLFTAESSCPVCIANPYNVMNMATDSGDTGPGCNWQASEWVSPGVDRQANKEASSAETCPHPSIMYAQGTAHKQHWRRKQYQHSTATFDATHARCMLLPAAFSRVHSLHNGPQRCSQHDC